MDVKKIVAVAAIAYMIPTGIIYAMPNVMPQTTFIDRATAVARGEAMELKAAEIPVKELARWCGWWGEKSADRSRLTITKGEPGWYGVEISWPRNATQIDMWTMSAIPVDSNTLQFKDCSHYLLTYKGKTIDKEELLYENGTGSLTMNSAGEIIWRDDQEHKGDTVSYVKLNLPDGGGL